MSGARRLASLWPHLAHLPVVAWSFAGPLFSGLVLYFRDVTYYYFPNAVFLERSLAHGVWPLWNPTSDAGAPFLVTDGVDLALVGLLGAEGALRFGPPLHQLLAMCGTTWLAGRLGLGPWGAWAAGLGFGLSGYFLSTVNLFELNHATAWAPWVIAAFVRLWSEPTPRRAAALGLVAALQVSTLGAETVIQTALFGLVLLPSPPERRKLAATAGAALVALLLCAPALLGVLGLVAGTPRAGGLAPETSFSFSLRPAALVDALVPRAFGDVHTLSDVGFWGQPFFPAGFPYLLSLYLGPACVWLALRGSRGRSGGRLLALALVGVLLALGSHGPLGWLLEPLMRHFRAPVKFLFLANLALALLAGTAIDRARRATLGKSRGAVAAGLLIAGFAAVLALRPELASLVARALAPEAAAPRAASAIAASWPAGLAAAGAFLVGAALACRYRALAPFAVALVALDLTVANGTVNLATAPSFYALRPEVSALLRKSDGGRVFAYGASGTPDLHWTEEVLRHNRDLALYAVDRQALAPRTHVLDGLDGVFDEDRVGWAPPGSTLHPREREPSLYSQYHTRMRIAGVRWVLSFRPLPEDLVAPRGEARLAELAEPLRLYELRDPLPPAFVVWNYEVEPDPRRRANRLAHPAFDPRTTVMLEEEPPPPRAAVPGVTGPGAVRFERAGPHLARLTVEGAPGLVVVVEGYHPAWTAGAADGARPLLRANGRYWAIPSAGGGETITVRYQPSWRTPALAALGLGLAVAAGLLVAGRQRRAGLDASA